MLGCRFRSSVAGRSSFSAQSSGARSENAQREKRSRKRSRSSSGSVHGCSQSKHAWSLAASVGARPATDRLTPTERRVAALVAEGRSTKEVAATLFVSPKTVEGHLSRIYTKLGIHSRTALARELSASR